MAVRMANCRLVGVLLAMTMLWLSLTDARSSGPPVGTEGLCSDMTPQHSNTSPQSSSPPYTITASETCYTSGQAVTVTLSGNGGSQFRGFFLQAREPNNNTASYGTFDVNGNSAAQTLDCFSQTENAVGHSSASDKSTTSFKWTPPSGLTGDVEFVATVVQEFNTYWVAAVKESIQPCDSMVTGSTVATTNIASAGDNLRSPANAAGMFVISGLLLQLLIMKLIVHRA